MKLIFTLLSLLFLAAPSARAEEPLPGHFDYYLLALSWQPAFCQSHSETPECRAESQRDESARHFSLHGLWPSRKNDPRHHYGYCGVDASTRALDREGRWCSLGESHASAALAIRMPGVRSCLQQHEWTKHGTCSTLSMEHYFSRSLELLDEFNNTPFAHKVSGLIGRTVAKRELLRAWNEAFPGRGDALELVCRKIDGLSYLTEVRVSLKKGLPAGLAQSLLNRKAGQPRCGAKLYIDAAGFNAAEPP